MKLNKLLQEYFTNNRLMQLATIADGQPWFCNVYFVTDENKPDGRAFWVLKPITISFWDEVNFPDSPKQELPL